MIIESFETVRAARQMGLHYMQFGRWGKDGVVTHVSKLNRLVPVKTPYDPKKEGEKALTHLEHLDDAVFNQGHEGVRHAIDTLMAAKHNDERILTTTKLDGSPSLVINSENGLSVGTKSTFNKNPKINRTEADVDANHGHAPGLAKKLKQSLEHLPKIHPHGKHQGDILFGEHDKQIMDIDGVPHVTFKPNTIRYAVPLESEMGQKINRAKFGIAIHSKYNEHGTLEPAHDSKFAEHPDVFVLPVEHATTKYDNPEFDEEMSRLGTMYKYTHPTTIQLASSAEHAPLFKQYINHRIRQGADIGTAANFTDWYHDYRMKEVNKLKTESGKQKKIDQLQKDLKFYNDNAHHINGAFAIASSIQRAKDHLVRHFNKSVAMKHYLDTEHGLEPTNPEGFVTHTHKGPVKFVDRMGFSRANFQMSQNRK